MQTMIFFQAVTMTVLFIFMGKEGLQLYIRIILATVALYFLNNTFHFSLLVLAFVYLACFYAIHRVMEVFNV